MATDRQTKKEAAPTELGTASHLLGFNQWLA
jgi:hypothetical protein